MEIFDEYYLILSYLIIFHEWDHDFIPLLSMHAFSCIFVPTYQWICPPQYVRPSVLPTFKKIGAFRLF